MTIKTNLPAFITFSGADDQTSIDGMRDLNVLYPIEWGILLSRDRAGSARYPSMSFVQRLLDCHPATVGHLSAHLCGSYAREVVVEGEIDDDGSVEQLLRSTFYRVQINVGADIERTKLDTRRIHQWARFLGVTPILQSRTQSFPLDGHVEWLFDASGGRGIAPTSWPFAKFGARCGYAGGLGPDNVAAAVAAISGRANGSTYWIDMESGVRDDNDRFDLERCRAVCEAVYGRRS